MKARTPGSNAQVSRLTCGIVIVKLTMLVSNLKLLLTTPCLSDRVKIQLVKRDKEPSRCHGDIYLNVNGSYDAVCVDDTVSYNEYISQVVCRELGCGTAVSVLQSSSRQKGQVSHVECLGQEESLWECIHKHGTDGSCKTITVICSGKCNESEMSANDK